MTSLRLVASLATLASCALLLPARIPGAEQLGGVQLVFEPFALRTDVGSSPADEEKTAEKFMRPITETANFFLQVYNLKGSCFDEYATHYDAPTSHFEKTIRIRIWRSDEAFVADYQKRYNTKSIPGAFFGINTVQDDYGNPTSTWIREIGCSTEGNDDSAVLRELYHEMGHLFMRTYIVRQVEVPSWIEEGTAELFQYRVGNGTHPEMEREQREGWLREMLEDKTEIPWKEMVNVHNLDNLDFTYKDPLRSVLQYVQAWSMMEFMVSNDLRQSAFLDMLHRFKQQAENKASTLGGLSAEEFLRQLQPYLYEIQDATFEKCYGNQLLEVENVWKKWIQHTYDLELPKKPQLHYYRGDWYLLRARLPRPGDNPKEFIEKASKIFEDCIVQQPKSPYGYVGRGRVFLLKGKLEEAGESFSQALKLGTTNYDALLYGGIARVMSGHCAEAVLPLTKAVAARGTDSQAHLYLGQALAASGGAIKDVVSHLHLARDLDPKLGPQCCFIEGGAQYLAGHSHEAYLAWLRTENHNTSMPDIQLFEAIAKADDSRDDAIALVKPVASSDAGKALIDILGDPKRQLPKIIFTPDGWPQIDFSGGEAIAKPPAGGDQAKPADPASGGGKLFGDPGAGQDPGAGGKPADPGK